MFVLAFLLTGLRAGAQGYIISVTNPPPPVALGGTLTYTYSVSNLSFSLTSMAITNTFSSPVTFLSQGTSYGTNYVVATNSNTLVFIFAPFTNNQIAVLSLTVQPSVIGLLTNTVVVTSFDFTNTATTNIVTQVYSGISDLGVTLVGPVQAVVTNDLTSYGVVITNLGPSAAPGVLFTNTLPPGVILKGVSPGSPGFSLSGSNMIFSLGTLASGAGTSFNFAIQPTNVGTYTFSASVGGPNLLDPNTTNNIASTNMNVIGYLPGDLFAFTNSAQTVNLQNGTLQQSILVSNSFAATTNVPAVRVVVTGLTNQLFNAVGTNNGNPFVYLSAPLNAGQATPLRLQYFPRNSVDHFPFTNGQLHAFAVPLPNWTPPPALNTATNVAVRKIIPLSNGDLLLEFPTVVGQTYTVVYSDNILFSNAMIAPPSIVAPANAVQWDDYGPPTTVSPTAAAPARFYRVYQNP